MLAERDDSQVGKRHEVWNTGHMTNTNCSVEIWVEWLIPRTYRDMCPSIGLMFTLGGPLPLSLDIDFFSLVQRGHDTIFSPSIVQIHTMIVSENHTRCLEQEKPILSHPSHVVLSTEVPPIPSAPTQTPQTPLNPSSPPFPLTPQNSHT